MLLVNPVAPESIGRYHRPSRVLGMACEEKAKNEVVVADFPTAIQTMRRIQQSFLVPVPPRRVSPLEPKGVVYTKRWVVELLLDLAGGTPPAQISSTPLPSSLRQETVRFLAA